jgi:hypothetical protein
MLHDCAGLAVFDVTMFGISQVVPASRSEAYSDQRLPRLGVLSLELPNSLKTHQPAELVKGVHVALP